MIRIAATITGALAAAGLAGCVAQIHHIVEPVNADAEFACSESLRRNSSPEIVGLAFSGGGSRAAVFAAASLEALWEHGLIDLVSHISSVSGGSLTSSYFVANPPACAAIDSSADQNACYREYFAQFKQAMRSNYLISMEKRQITKFRMFSNTRRATSLQESFDERFLHGTTFADLAEGAAGASSGERRPPILLINAASYDDGRRFVFSNLCLPESLAPVPDEIVGNPLNETSLRTLTLSRTGCTRPVPGDMPLSLAVATSAAYPGIGPVTIQVPSTCAGGRPEFWHLGDGGLFENSGVDTLEEIILREQRTAPRLLDRALIMSIVSGKSNNANELRSISNFWLFSYHSPLIVDAYNRRAQGYHDLLWQRLGEDLSDQGLQIEKIEFRYTAAKIDRWPASCKQADSTDQHSGDVRAAISAELNKIKTSFKIPDCHADLLEIAAHDVVHSRLDAETMARLKQMGFSIRDERSIH